MSITDFLLARIAEDEEQAEVCRKLGWFPASKYEMTAVSYARVLAESAAKRAIVEQWVSTMGWANNTDCDNPVAYQNIACGMGDAVKILTAVYAEHPGYLDEWRVGA